MFRTIMNEADSALQSRTCLALPLFVEDPEADPGAGSYTAEEWARRRLLQTEPFRSDENRYRSDEDYRMYLASIHESKILSVESLIRTFDFRRYKRVIELGCGDMPQAYTIFSRFPEIDYAATDFDSRVIESCSGLRLLDGIRKFAFDVAVDDLAELKNYDLVVSWSLEFSLDDSNLLKLFSACKKYSKPYLLCSHTTIGPFGYVSRVLFQRALRKRLGGNGIRVLGWLRSTGEIARIAAQGGMTLQCETRHVNHSVLLFTPA